MITSLLYENCSHSIPLLFSKNDNDTYIESYLLISEMCKCLPVTQSTFKFTFDHFTLNETNTTGNKQMSLFNQDERFDFPWGMI